MVAYIPYRVCHAHVVAPSMAYCVLTCVLTHTTRLSDRPHSVPSLRTRLAGFMWFALIVTAAGAMRGALHCTALHSLVDALAYSMY